MALTDKALIRFLSGGDVKAFNELFLRFHIRVYRFAVNILHSGTDAEEVVQEVFIAIWQNRRQIRAESFEAYLFGIARNQVHSILRKQAYFNQSLLFFGKNLATEYNPVEEQIELDEIQQFFSEQIDLLPDRRRQIFCLSRLGELTYKEIAQKLNISENTVDTQIRHALDALRKAYLKKFF